MNYESRIMKSFLKKAIRIVFASLILNSLFFIPTVWAATTFSFSSTEVSVPQGQSFILRLVFDPGGTNNYTAKIDLSFPSELVRIDSFQFAENWLALSQPGYDLIDNRAGTFVKTAGYPAGVSSPVVFGTVTFSVKRIGSGVIIVGDNSLILNAVSENVFAGLPVKATIIATGQATPFASEFDIPDRIPIGFFFEEDLVFGNRTIEVAYLQICLKSQFGLYRGVVTGEFDDATFEAVTEFQNRYFGGVLEPEYFAGKSGTGFVDEGTRTKLNRGCKSQVERETPPVIFDITVEPTILGEKERPFMVIIIGILIIIVAYFIHRKMYKARLREKIDQM